MWHNTARSDEELQTDLSHPLEINNVWYAPWYYNGESCLSYDRIHALSYIIIKKILFYSTCINGYLAVTSHGDEMGITRHESKKGTFLFHPMGTT